MTVKQLRKRREPGSSRSAAKGNPRCELSGIGCSDSREPPEVIFDQGPGNHLVARVAGNLAGLRQLRRLGEENRTLQQMP